MAKKGTFPFPPKPAPGSKPATPGAPAPGGKPPFPPIKPKGKPGGK